MVLDALQHPSDSDSTENCLSKELKEAYGSKVAQHLVCHAKASGSTDNITVALVFLRPPEQLLVKINAAATVKKSPHPETAVPGS